MYVLGLVGWGERSHDATACLVRDKHIIAMAEEERFSRKKHAYDSFPHNSIQFCLEEGGISLDDVDIVAVGWNMPSQYARIRRQWDLAQKDIADVFFPPNYFRRSRDPNIEFVDHHLSHASSTYRVSGFEESAILVVDGQGEHSSGSIWHGKNGKIRRIKAFRIADSLGYFYEALTQFCGFRSNEPGKLMGLSSYGEPVFDFEKFFVLEKDGYCIRINGRPIEIDETKSIDQQEDLSKAWFEAFRKYTEPNKPVYRFDSRRKVFVKDYVQMKVYEDLAASGQRALEYVMTHLAEVATRLTGSRNLCVAGGVGLNCLTNGKILRSGFVDKLFIQPAAVDSGCALGAALEITGQYKVPFTPYLGPDFSDEEIEIVFKKKGIRYRKSERVEEDTAILLSQGKIGGWLQGRMEVGPRALGNRSIIADPRDLQMKDKVNENVKFRESFRPFAPSILSERVGEYLDEGQNSPFMLLSFDVKKERKKELGAVTHVDGTTRPQTVDDNNPRFRDLTRSFEKTTGVPAVLNTSFNVKGEPIVCTPDDAISCFFSNGMDFLVMGNYLVEKH